MEPRTGMGEPLRDPGSSNEQHQHAAERRGAPSGSPRQPAGGSGRVGAATAAASSPGPLGSSSWPSSLAFSWVSPLLHRGSTQVQLHQQDLFDLPQDLLPATCRRRLLRHWHDEQQRANLRGGGAAGLPAPSLLRAIVAAYGWPYLLLGLLKAAGDALNFAGPLLLNLLLRHLAGSGGSNSSATLGVAGWQVNMVAPLFGYCCVALLAASLVLKAFLGAHYGYRQALVASQLRSAVTATVFRKALAVNAATLAATGSGRVQTLMSVDAERLVTLCLSFHELWSLPVQIVVALWMLYTQVQCAFLAGLALVLLLIPLNHWLAKRIQEASIQMMAAKDRRVRAMMEILRGIRQIKCYAWEGAFAARVVGERRAELAALAVCKYMDALCVYFWAAISLLFSLTTFGLYALMGHQLTPQAVFTSLALFNVLLAPINAFPWVINGVVEAVVSVRRLSEFLRAPETVGPSSPASSSQVTQGAAISVASSFAWSSNRSSSSVDSKHSMAADQHQQRSPGGGAVLQDMALVVPAGALVALTGPVGSGKSSLLAAVLGEMLPAGPGQPQSGDKEGSGSRGGCVAAGSSVAYVPQEPWIMHGTLRDNVLLGQPYDGQRYTAVLHACALLPDLQDMPAGDMTMVGGAGATLSGGQRARLALARALYKDPSVLLLDDCLAAVDARVAGWILRHALLGPLLWGEQDGMQQERGKEQQRLRTAVVATHTPALLAVADMVVELRGGRVAAVRLQPEAAALRRQEVVTAAAAAAEEEGSPASRAPAHMEATPGTFDTAGDEERLEVQGGAAGEERVREQAQPPQEEEERQQGHVRWGVYQRYVAATGWGWATVILLSMLLMQTTRNGNDLWLSHWVSQVLHPNSTSNQPRQPQLPWCSHASPAPGVPPPACMPGIPLIDLSSHSSGSGSGSDSSGWGTSSSWNRNSTSSTSGGYSSMSSSLLFSSGNGLDPTVRYYLSVLLAIATANSVVTLVRAFSFAKGGLVAAKRVHEQLLAAVLALPLAFFDATPPGRILNRFSSDTATVDDSLPFILNIALASCFSLAGVAVVLCLTQPLVLVLLPLLALAYRRLQLYYRATSRELRRLDAVAKSPVYTAFSEALSGGPTIRAFGAQAPFLAAAEAAVAAQQRASVSSAAAGSWLGLRLQLMAAALAVAVAGAAVAERAGSLPPFLADGGLRGGGGRSGRSGMAAGLVGLSLSYVLPITGLLSGLLASSAETEQEMVAAERVFQYLELGGKGCSGGSSGRRDRTCRPLPKQAAVSVRQKAASSEGSDIEAQQPLLQQPLRSPLAADRLRNCGVSSSSSSDCWLHSGHVSFEDVWLCYEPWSSGGSSAAASSSCDGAVGFIDTGSDSSSGGSGASGTAPSKGPAPDDSSSSCGSSSPWVLRGVTLDVQAGSHVGICGRTGAGKSSLLAALLRLAPIARGKVSIDGHNIAAIPVQDLRRAVGVVPQHPFLFEGSVWQNLDPLGRHTTAELAAVLHQVALWHPLLAQLPGIDAASAAGAAAATADTSICASSRQEQQQQVVAPHQGEALARQVLALRLGEGAAALSQGQQQLLALGRVLLWRPLLLVLDEATSSVDPGTANVMHEVIRRHLAGTTIIEVAHRQSTIARCSRVVVMEAGRVAEER